LDERQQSAEKQRGKLDSQLMTTSRHGGGVFFPSPKDKVGELKQISRGRDLSQQEIFGVWGQSGQKRKRAGSQTGVRGDEPAGQRGGFGKHGL